MAQLIARMFGGDKKGEAPSPQKAIQKLRETEEMLNKKSEFLETRIQRELETAKKHGLKNKRAAMASLKRKKMLERKLSQIDGTLSTIEFQREAVERASTNTEVLKNMSYAAKSLKAAQQNLNLDDVHNILDDIQEQNQISDEITEAITEPRGFSAEFDEDDLLQELEDMEQQDLEKDLLSVPAPLGGENPLDQLPDIQHGKHLQLGKRPPHSFPPVAWSYNLKHCPSKIIKNGWSNYKYYFHGSNVDTEDDDDDTDGISHEIRLSA